MTKRLKPYLTALAGLLAVTMASPAAANLDEILNEGTIEIGVPENFPPFGSLGAEGEYEGYDVDVARMIAKDLGVDLELVPITSKQRIPYLETDRVDLVISSMGANPTRAKSIWFSNAYAPFFSGAFAAPDVEVSSPDDLTGLKAGVTGGTIEDIELSDMAPDGVQIVRFGDNAATLEAYKSGQVDVLVTGNTVAANLAANNDDIQLETKFVIKESPAFMGIKKGNMDLLRWVNVFILHKRLGGELDDLSQKWLGQKLPDLPTL
jgi:polar amino acid transport system substrate-binding protein